MPDNREKHELARIALRRRFGAPPAPSGGSREAGSSSSSSGGPSRDEMDEMFDRSFEATFRPAAAAEPAPPAAGVGALRQTGDIPVDIAEPVSEAEAAAGGSPGVRAELLRLAREAGVPAIDLDRVTADLSQLDFVPRDIALRHLLLPLCVREGQLFVAVADPQQRRALDELEFVSGLRLVPHVAAAARLRPFIESCYRAHAAGQRTFGLPGALPVGQLEPVVVRPSGAPPPPGEVDRAVVPAGAPLVAPEVPGPEPPSVEPDRPRARRRVLVVDDESDIRLLVARVLRDKGYEVLEAAHGAEALRMVQAQLPDLLVLDAMLPEIHGFDVCRRIKASPRYRHIPVILISAIYRGWRFAADLKKSYGVDGYLEKPFKIAELVERVEQLLTGRPAAPPPARELSARAQAELAAGMQAARAGDLDAAIRHLQAGLEADPLSHPIHYQLGGLYARQGRLYEAIQALETALEIEPGDFATLRGLGQLYEQAGFPCKAVEMWERAAGATTDEALRHSIKEHLLKLL